jgi:hypothetical protein
MINITKRGWQHVLKHHTATQSPTPTNKSTFNMGEDLIQLTRLNGDLVNMFPGLP